MNETKHEPTTSSTVNWRKLVAFPCKLHSNFVVINKHEFIALPDHYPNQPKDSKAQQADGIYKYNVRSKQWTVYIKYPNYITMALDSVAIDYEKHILYAHNKASKSDSVIVFDLKKKMIKRKRQKAKEKDANPTPIGIGSSGIVINNIYQIIYGRKNRHHLEFIDNEFKICHSWTKWKKGNVDHGLIHIKSQNVLLLFGGKRLTPKNKQKSSDTNSIWRYSIGTSKWIKLKQRLPYKCSNFAYILTNDEKYIILFGANGAKKKNIDIVNLSTMKCQTSIISMPTDVACYAIITDKNYVHLIRKQGGDHWEIKLQHILQCKHNDLEDAKNDDIDGLDLWNCLKWKDKNMKLFAMTIKELKQEMDILKKSEQKLKSLNIKLLNEREEMEQKCIRFQKLTSYDSWNVDDVYEWIINVDNCRYNKYWNALQLNLKKENVNGKCLEVINEMDLHRIGITDFMDKKLLKKQINSLIKNTKRRDDELPICIICYNDTINYVIEPCHHLYCKQCAVKFKQCPKCRTTITSSFQVYY